MPNDSKFGDLLVEDDKIRKYLKKTLYNARRADASRLSVPAARFTLSCTVPSPGMVIGKGGAEIEKLKTEPGAR